MAQLEDAYYDLAAFQLNVRWRRSRWRRCRGFSTRPASRRKPASMSRLDVMTAESQVAASQRDLLVAQTNLAAAGNHPEAVVEQARRPGSG